MLDDDEGTSVLGSRLEKSKSGGDYRKPLVSVIVPAYNHERFVRMCLESVLNQSYRNLEVIIFDDGSTDMTRMVVEGFLRDFRDARFRFIHKDNEGVCRTLNRGLEIARGEYLCLIASDDWWALNKIENQVRFMESHPEVGLVFSDAFMVNTESKVFSTWCSYKPFIQNLFLESVRGPEICEDIFIKTFIPGLTVMIRFSDIRKVGEFDKTLLAEDVDMWLRMSQVAKIGFINEPLAYYRMHDHNVTNSIGFMIKAGIDILWKYFSMRSLIERPLHVACIVLRIVIYRVSNRFSRALVRRKA